MKKNKNLKIKKDYSMDLPPQIPALLESSTSLQELDEQPDLPPRMNKEIKEI
jgi:hypothetical protein